MLHEDQACALLYMLVLNKSSELLRDLKTFIMFSQVQNYSSFDCGKLTNFSKKDQIRL